MTENSDRFWPDGTPKSQGNAFTGHGYVRGLAAAPSAKPQKHVRGGFGAASGTIPGMGSPAFNAPLKKLRA